MINIHLMCASNNNIININKDDDSMVSIMLNENRGIIFGPMKIQFL